MAKLMKGMKATAELAEIIAKHVSEVVCTTQGWTGLCLYDIFQDEVRSKAYGFSTTNQNGKKLEIHLAIWKKEGDEWEGGDVRVVEADGPEVLFSYFEITWEDENATVKFTT